jgi:hypothetical protein
LFFGSGNYRESDPYLAFVRTEAVEDRQAWRFFAGLQGGVPRWSENERDAVSLFSHPCIGELSVTWNAFLKKWLMLYNCTNPRGVNFRTADNPWGPWSASQILFHPTDDKGFCFFIHRSYAEQNCDAVHDPTRENDNGGAYGPYVIARLTTGQANRSTIYFTLSTWNPYQVVLMKSTLQLQ